MSVVVRPARDDDAPAVATIHADRIAEGFLVVLGPRFLARLYRRIARSERAALIVAERDGRVVAFAAAAANTRDLYKEFLLRDAVPAALGAAPAIVRSPRRVWETLRYGTAPTADDLPEAEILSIAVDSAATGEGIGGRVLHDAIEALRRLGATEARVVTAPDNAPAIRMYERAGFERRAQTAVHRGDVQEVLVWR